MRYREISTRLREIAETLPIYDDPMWGPEDLKPIQTAVKVEQARVDLLWIARWLAEIADNATIATAEAVKEIVAAEARTHRHND